MSFLCHFYVISLPSSAISKTFDKLQNFQEFPFFNFYKNLNFIYKYGIQVGHVGIFKDQNSTFYFYKIVSSWSEARLHLRLPDLVFTGN